jgi:hypothetical protein
MMDCPHCAFALGKAVREAHLHSLKLDDVKREQFWGTLPDWLWEAYCDYLNKKPEKPWGVSGQNALTRVLA